MSTRQVILESMDEISGQEIVAYVELFQEAGDIYLEFKGVDFVAKSPSTVTLRVSRVLGFALGLPKVESQW